MTGRAEFLHEAGYSVLLFDFQAHGESPGDHVTMGYLEALDAEAALAYLKQRSASTFTAAIGVSLGGAAVVLGPRPLDLDALVLEAVYPFIGSAVENRLEIRFGSAGRLLAPLLLMQLQPRMGILEEDLAPVVGIKSVSAPLLIMVGSEDRHTTLGDTQRIFDAAPSKKRLWIVAGAGHVDLERHLRVEYHSRVLAFLGEARADGN